MTYLYHMEELQELSLDNGKSKHLNLYSPIALECAYKKKIKKSNAERSSLGSQTKNECETTCRVNPDGHDDIKGHSRTSASQF